MKSKHPKEVLDKLKEYFINNDVTLNDLADNSESIAGRKVSLADLKFYSRSDTDGPWSVLKGNNGRRTIDVPISEKLQKVADKLYDLIIGDEENLSGNQLAALAKTWSDLIDKAKLNKDTSSAKTTVQQVKEIFEKSMAEGNENSKSN